jgi:hypothetical protein
MFNTWEKTHPLQGGIFRLKYRRDRRPSLPREPVWTFYPKYLWETARKLVAFGTTALRLYSVKKTIKADPNRFAYMDAAISPVTDEDVDKLDLFNQNDAAKHAVQHERHVHELTHANIAAE